MTFKGDKQRNCPCTRPRTIARRSRRRSRRCRECGGRSKVRLGSGALTNIWIRQLTWLIMSWQVAQASGHPMSFSSTGLRTNATLIWTSQQSSRLLLPHISPRQTSNRSAHLKRLLLLLWTPKRLGNSRTPTVLKACSSIPTTKDTSLISKPGTKKLGRPI